MYTDIILFKVYDSYRRCYCDHTHSTADNGAASLITNDSHKVTYCTYTSASFTLTLFAFQYYSNKHLGLIADSMHEWEGPVAEELLLAPADVANIKTKYPIQLTLQT